MKLNEKRVKEIVKEKGTSLREVSLKLGWRQEQMSEYTRGQTNCPKKKIMQIADYLDVNWLEIVDIQRSYY